MGLYPGATFVPVGGTKVARNRQGRGILHVAVSERRSYAPTPPNTWHFYVAKDGYCEQYVDTNFCAYASAAANDDAISIETAGGMGTSSVLNAERWTRAQELRLADIMRWEAQQPGGAPLALLPDAKPGRQGWGPHRLGIKHSRGLVPGWWFPGCELWSSHLGKECPGDAKVAQIPGIIELARTGSLEDDMSAEAEKKIAEIHAMLGAGNAVGMAQYDTIGARLARVEGVLFAGTSGTPKDLTAYQRLARIEEAINDIPGGEVGEVDVKAIAEQLTVVPKA